MKYFQSQKYIMEDKILWEKMYGNDFKDKKEQCKLSEC